MKNKLDKEILSAMSRDPQNWKGPFYYNKKDYRVIVPKYSPWMGWTLNFASPYAYVSLALIIIIAVLSKYFLK
ncbi:MAG: hypothetical protein ACM3P1_06635 [Candidatus Saccharibacteria bacterium]